MLANYGYKDGSGDFFITIDTDRCNGCGKCITACPAGVLELITDESDPFRELPVAAITEAHRKKIKYSCAPCHAYGGSAEGTGQQEKTASDKTTTGTQPDRTSGLAEMLPCLKACVYTAISHSW